MQWGSRPHEVSKIVWVARPVVNTGQGTQMSHPGCFTIVVSMVPHENLNADLELAPEVVCPPASAVPNTFSVVPC